MIPETDSKTGDKVVVAITSKQILPLGYKIISGSSVVVVEEVVVVVGRL
jgi:hypothetical protein